MQLRSILSKGKPFSFYLVKNKSEKNASVFSHTKERNNDAIRPSSLHADVRDMELANNDRIGQGVVVTLRRRRPAQCMRESARFSHRPSHPWSQTAIVAGAQSPWVIPRESKRVKRTYVDACCFPQRNVNMHMILGEEHTSSTRSGEVMLYTLWKRAENLT